MPIPEATDSLPCGGVQTTHRPNMTCIHTFLLISFLRGALSPTRPFLRSCEPGRRTDGQKGRPCPSPGSRNQDPEDIDCDFILIFIFSPLLLA